MKKVLVIIPTYNESENIIRLINEILSIKLDNVLFNVLVVDDNSPDNTSEIVRNLNNENVFLIERKGKMGLGTAYIEGFKFAIKNNYHYAFEMDADFSHDPKAIPDFLSKIDEFDLVIGSRYVNGIRVVNWPLRRLIISILASLYTRVITGLPVKDVTAGFMCYNIESLKKVDIENVKSNGYSFQIEMKFRMWKSGFKLHEIPIIFVDRRAGLSKMTKKIVYEAIFMVWKLKLMSILRKI